MGKLFHKKSIVEIPHEVSLKEQIQENTAPEEEFSFEGQKDQEEIILVAKRHPMTLYYTGLKVVGGALVLIAIVTIFGLIIYTSLAFLVYLVTIGYHAFKDWYLWWSSHYLLTTERVIGIEQRGFFHRTVSEATLDTIMNVGFEIKGPYETFLDYGTIQVITTGKGEPDVEFVCVPHPYKIQQEITSAAYEYGRTNKIKEKHA